MALLVYYSSATGNTDYFVQQIGEPSLRLFKKTAIIPIILCNKLVNRL